MIINSVIIREGLFEKPFVFSNKVNLIFSQGNSVGKTTLLRVILYSLGYNVPGTKRFPIEKNEYKTEVTTDKGETIELVRRTPNYIVCRSGEDSCVYYLPDQQNIIHSKLFYTENVNVLNNILGAYYLDQEKGWTLLNRGRVIGSIHFNLEDFIQGLSGRDCSALKEQKEWLEKELLKYEQISNVTKYKESLDSFSGSLLREDYDDEIDVQIKLKQVELNNVKRDLSQIDRVLKSNKQFKKFVEDMKLMVETPQGSPMIVTADKVIGLNDSIDYLIAKREIRAIDYNILTKSIEQLRSKKKNDLSSLFSVQSISEAFDEMVQKFPYSYIKIEEIKENLRRQLSLIKKQITDKTRANNSVVSSLFSNVIKYADELGIGDESFMNLNYLFTSNMKILSGALLHKTVFAFRLAYILEVKRLLGVKLPIILDSPSGKEVDASNVKLMISILKRDFSDHQLIIASIYEYDLPEVNKIEIKRMLLEDVD